MSKTTLFPTIPLIELKQRKEDHRYDSLKPVILVVDDEAIIADTLAVILSKQGYMAMVAYDGKSALEIAEIVPPDLLLSDVVMPGMNGIDLAVAIKQAIPACKVLLFSGQATTASLLDSTGPAATDFAVLSKPLHPTDLLARVSASLKSPILTVQTPSRQPELCEEKSIR
jgi:DNA-binding response OmpR family regulator